MLQQSSVVAMQPMMMVPTKIDNPILVRPPRIWKAPLGCCQCCALSQCWFWSLWWMFGFGIVASLMFVYALMQWTDCDKKYNHSNYSSSVWHQCYSIANFSFFGSMALYGLGGIFFLVLPFGCCCRCLKATPIPRDEGRDDRCCAPCKRTVSPAFWTTLGWAFLLIVSGGALEAVGLLVLNDQEVLPYDKPFQFSNAQVSTSDYTSLSWYALMWRIGALMVALGVLLLLGSISACCKCCTGCRMQPRELEAWFEEDEAVLYPPAGYGIAITQYQPVANQAHGTAQVAPSPYGGMVASTEYNYNNIHKPAAFVTPEQAVSNNRTTRSAAIVVKPMAAPVVTPTRIQPASPSQQSPSTQPYSSATPLSPSAASSVDKDINFSPSLHPGAAQTIFEQLQVLMDRLVVAGYADKLRPEQSLEADECRLAIITAVQTLHALPRNHRLELQSDLRAARKLNLKAGLEVVRLSGVKQQPSGISLDGSVVTAFLSTPAFKDSRVSYIQGVQVRSRLAALALLQGPLCLPGQEVLVEVEPIDQSSSRLLLKFVMEPAVSSTIAGGALSTAGMDVESAKRSYGKLQAQLERLKQLAVEAERTATPPLRLTVQRREVEEDDEAASYEAATSNAAENGSDEESS